MMKFLFGTINLTLIMILITIKATISQPTILNALGVLYTLSIHSYLINAIKQVTLFLF